MKFLLALFTVFLISSCAHHHKNPEHHHHAFNKQCAGAVLEGDYETHGKDEINLKHGDVTYYFSSIEKKKKFEKNIETNVKKAENNWSQFGPLSERGGGRK